MISVVIPSYNRRESVLELLGDLIQQKGTQFEIIVVDDCSPDGSAEAIESAFPSVTLLRNEKNGGPCVTRNRGIRAAQGDIIVGLDSDVRVPDTTLLERTAKTFSQLSTNVQGLAFRLLQPDGISEDKARWWHPVPIENFANQMFETSYFSGTGYAFRRRPMIAAGLFPEILYMHYEEVELAWRILDDGGQIIYCPTLIVIHHEHQVSRRNEIKTFYKVRNQILLTVACLPTIQGVFFLLPRIFYAGLNAFLRGHFLSFIRALKSATTLTKNRLGHRKPISLSTRKRIRKMRSGITLTAPIVPEACEN